MQVFHAAKKVLKILFGLVRHVKPMTEEEIRELCGSPEMDRLELIKAGRHQLHELGVKYSSLLDSAILSDFDTVEVAHVKRTELALARGLDKLANTTVLRWQVLKLILKEKFA